MSLAQVLYLFGLGYFVANMLVVADVVRFRRWMRTALVTWPSPRPPFYRLSLGIGVALGVLLAVRMGLQHQAPWNLFGETMMFLYYAYAIVLRRQVRRGLYQDGVWTDTGFMRWEQIDGVSWRERGEVVTLVLVKRARQLARTLQVPGTAYGEVRRVLREKVAAHAIRFRGVGLDLGVRDERDAV
jgi:hypothetical protein